MTKQFVIIFPERSGSTMLVTMLNSHPGIICGFENFAFVEQNGKNSLRIGSNFYGPNDERLIEAIDLELSKTYSKGNKMKGFKFKYIPDQISHFPQVMEYLYQRKENVKLILLNRSNYLRAAISKMNLSKLRNETGKSNLFLKQKGEEFKFRSEKIYLNIPWLIRYMNFRHQKFLEYSAIASNFKHVLHIDYEELNNSQKDTSIKILEFLGVNSKISITPRTIKVTKAEDFKELIENYDEIKNAIMDSEFKYLLP